MECKGCVKGIEWCETRSCWGTPAEFDRIMDEGHAGDLMLDYWIGGFKTYDDVQILSGALPGYGGKNAPFWPMGSCVFLTEDKLCSIHHIKPTEGREECCEVESNGGLHEKMARAWESTAGRKAVRKWRNIIDGKLPDKEITGI